jgi:bifunctional DNA-binding transcriptional regulator/antitoxin component of YhaV-PrlF toxin-antitoxin module
MTFKTKLQDGRISLPTRLRTLAGVSNGDPVNVTLEQGRFIVTPAQRIGRAPSAKQQRAEFLRRLRAEAPASLKAMWAEAQRKGTDKMTMREIDAIIAEVRAEQAAKQKTKQPVR